MESQSPIIGEFLGRRGAAGGWAAVATIVAMSLAGPASAVAATPAINADLSKTQGPIRHAASGMLWAFWQGSPPENVMATLYDPLKIQFLRCSTADWVIQENMDRDPIAKKIVVLSDPWGYPSRGTYQDPPWFTNPPSSWWKKTVPINWSAYESYVTQQIANVKAAYAAAGVTGVAPVYDAWNEPNENEFFLDWLKKTDGTPKYDGKQAWPQEGKDKYWELYRRTYNLVRQLHPEAEITGPSDGQTEPGAMQGVREFKAYCVANNCVPDYWNWHYGIDTFEDDCKEAAGWGLNKGVILGEYLGPDQSSRPGHTAWQMAIYETTTLVGATRGTWGSRNYGVSRGNLGWTIFQDTDGQWKKHGTWWAFATYAAMTGDRMQCVTANDSLMKVRGLITYDKKKRSVMGLLGNSRYETDPYNSSLNNKPNGYQGNVDVNIQGVLPLGRTVRLVVERLPSGITGFDPIDGVTPIAVEVPAPVLVSDATVSTLSNKISFRINWADGNDAYRFTITAP